MKYYIATKLENNHKHNLVRNQLSDIGWSLTYDWTTHGSVKNTSVDRLNEVAHNEVRGVLSADVVIILLPGGRGTHTELGLAIGLNKIIVVHSEDEKFFQANSDTCAFYHHNQIHRLVCPINDLATLVGKSSKAILEFTD
ncbi:MAG: hypothetical protein HOI53_09255 [Francisellaceae bacterium]|jgi:nucleoside 2-deoxyribosyltransferase|nr:hypothetical protein [Francisellaceae bacterium]MBT6208200.1 hypothetical protein [Francisellaceae bacterium]MBT6538739.1 hypothetical protein [Francisellaceae bacterium]